MGEYFRPWRRKLGVVTLGLSLAAVIWGIRSYYVHDLVRFWTGPRIWHIVGSEHGSFYWALNFDEQTPRWFFPIYESGSTIGTVHPFVDPHMDWDWKFCGFGQGDYPMGPGWLIPCWSIVVPLMLLSAWLLLSKPRKREARGSVNISPLRGD